MVFYDAISAQRGQDKVWSVGNDKYLIWSQGQIM